MIQEQKKMKKQYLYTMITMAVNQINLFCSVPYTHTHTQCHHHRRIFFVVVPFYSPNKRKNRMIKKNFRQT